MFSDFVSRLLIKGWGEAKSVFIENVEVNGRMLKNINQMAAAIS